MDDHSHESVPSKQTSRQSGARVSGRLAMTGRLPTSIFVDNGPEFAGNVLAPWDYRNHPKLPFVYPGNPR